MGQTMGQMAERQVIFLDTHIVVWLYEGKKRFTELGRQKLSKSDLRISPIVRFGKRDCGIKQLLSTSGSAKISFPSMIIPVGEMEASQAFGELLSVSKSHKTKDAPPPSAAKDQDAVLSYSIQLSINCFISIHLFYYI